MSLLFASFLLKPNINSGDLPKVKTAKLYFSLFFSLAFGLVCKRKIRALKHFFIFHIKFKRLSSMNKFYCIQLDLEINQFEILVIS